MIINDNQELQARLNNLRTLPVVPPVRVAMVKSLSGVWNPISVGPIKNF